MDLIPSTLNPLPQTLYPFHSTRHLKSKGSRLRITERFLTTALYQKRCLKKRKRKINNRTDSGVEK